MSTYKEPHEQTDGELAAELEASYTADPVPPCRVCGGKLSVASMGGGRATEWACDGMEPDPERPGCVRYKAGRSCADDHFGKSFWTQYRAGDSRVLELVRRFREAKAV